MPRLLLLFIAILFTRPAFLPVPVRAQEAPPVRAAVGDARLSLGGLVQGRFSYGRTDPAGAQDATERVGFGLRRARLRALAEVGRTSAFVQVDGAGGTVQLVDAYAGFRLGERVRLRVGRLAGAQPRSLILTSSTRIDAVDRAAIAERWGRQTLGGDGRDFGLELRYGGRHAELLAFVHNGDGNWSRLRGNVRQGPSENDATGGVSTSGLAVTLAAAWRPGAPDGLEVGGFAGFNGSRNPNTRRDDDARGRDYVTYGAHAYWGAEPGSRAVRLKADVLGIVYAAPTRFEARQHTFGAALLGALRLHRAAELFARAERFERDLDRPDTGDTYVTGGVSLSLSALQGRPYHRERLTLGYTAVLPDDDTAATHHLALLQLQIAF
ncbi:MAG: hypothetical protein KatS3mg042_0205 [Rhodothermaceae bacterium]|nr:MAG: hypothetical protein KatS3mg042_0205 [Rhodothermaceae bacterium]